MNVRPMILGAEELGRLKELKEYAEANPWTINYQLDANNGQRSGPGLIDEYQCSIPLGYKVVFTIEANPAGMVRHLSMSVKDGDRLPNPGGAKMIMHILGFKQPLMNCKISVEDLLDGGQAINIGELIEFM